jgi:hypothetical protein
MARLTYRDYAYEAYARARAKRDRNGKGAHHGNGRPPQKFDKLAGSIELQNIERDLDRQRTDRDRLEFFRKHGEIIQLRRDGRSLQEIADETGDSRVGVFRKLQKVPSTKLKIELGVST